MNKHERFYNKVEKFKDRFRKLSTETIRHRLETGLLVKEAEIAYREILEERGEQVRINSSKAQASGKHVGP